MPLERASDFAAHVAHYLWFTDLQNTPFWNFDSCQPRTQFKKFCRDVVNATQVSHSVIALSLLYIYRMKIKVPPIQGHPGSEFRAFTVALMLANKFLDDNTYTNKTWSEVTNIPVKEINIMEMEFLSSLDFSLFVSLDDYYNWVYSIDAHIPNNDDSMNDDSNAPDCAIPIPQAIDYNLQVQSQNIVPISQPQQLVSSMVCTSTALPMETMQQSSAVSTSYKRSVDQAFVDGIITSPPKRSNASSNYSTVTLPNNYFPASVNVQSSNNGLVYGNTTMYDFQQSYGNAPSQYTLVDPVSVLYTASRRMSLYNVRASALPINAISFQTAVNAI
ncbi:10515_t:CDS:2 [Paraglomus brasilianum]|uniref:10515_t:CDS:1 n=1 Tax=Paraglomus brasilianum TaxID=144538 RepID=A0A9N8YX71_9GLOM|nr:10515_t:CDS:2 [Paraglomus brasilianum]